ncbi:MAG: putative membrane protein YecN with MAPEG domain [Myxococcota bacterium]|jgi:uncharacterized membrane protein YecN with MAPEG domain
MTATLPLISIFLSSVFVLLGVFLTVRVIIGRVRYEVVNGDGGIDDLGCRIRAHGNFTEQTPLALLMLTFAELVGAPSVVVIGLGAALLATRILSAVGLSRTREQNPLRQSGAGATQLTLVITALVVLFMSARHLIG